MKYSHLFLLPVFACQPDWVSDPEKLLEDTDVAPPADDDPQPQDTDPDTDDPVEDPDPPTLNISVEPIFFIGDEVIFDGSASTDPQGFALAYDWSCDNGESGSEATLTFTATQIGRVECELSVTNTDGLTTTGTESTSIQNTGGEAEWTVMVFIAGDNNLEQAGVDDINEMEIAGSTPNVNFLAEIDRSPGYSDIDGNWSGTRRFYIEQDFSNSINSPVMADLGPTDSGSIQAVIDFVEWGVTYYPAEKYALVLWNHGWSWWDFNSRGTATKGILDDESTGNSISVAEGELTQMLEEVTAITGKKLEILGMDACIMQSWEIAHESFPFANYYVASQDYEPFDGWNYEDSYLDLIANPTWDGAELGASFAETYYDIDPYNTALSTVDLAQLPAFETALDELSYALMNGNSGQLFRQAARNSYSYDGSNQGIDHDIGNMLDYFIANTSNQDIVQHATSAKTALESMITSNYVQGNASSATGLSIYSPPRRNWGIENAYLNAPWAEDTVWDDMLVTLFE